MKKIVASRWFNPGGAGSSCIGIIVVDVPHEGLKTYIGIGQGLSLANDEQRVADWGVHFPDNVARVMFPEIFDCDRGCINES